MIKITSKLKSEKKELLISGEVNVKKLFHSVMHFLDVRRRLSTVSMQKQDEACPIKLQLCWKVNTIKRAFLNDNYQMRNTAEGTN